MISVIALWLLVLLETGLLLLLLHALGKLRQQGTLASSQTAGKVVSIGEKAPSFTAKDQDGHAVGLEELRGQRCVLAFVSPGCSACAGAVDAFNEFLQEASSLPLIMVGGPDARRNLAYAQEHQARVPLWTAPASVPMEQYHVPGVPFVFVLDEEHIIRAGGTVNEYAHLQALLTTAFGTQMTQEEPLTSATTF